MCKWILTVGFIALTVGLNQHVEGLPKVVKIGALFLEDQKGSSAELAFKYAVYKVNKDPDLLPNSTIHYDIDYVTLEDSFHASKKVCRQIQHGAFAIFGPPDPFIGSHVQSICDALDIPHLDARLDINSDEKEFSINMHPAPSSLNRAFQDIMDLLNWTRVAIVYEEDYGLIKLQDLVRSPGAYNREVFLQQASAETFKDVMKEIKSREIYNIIVDISTGHSMTEFLKGILKLHMNDYKYHYLFTTFDVEAYDLEEFKYNFVNITAFRLVDADHYRTLQTFKEMERFQPSTNLSEKSRFLQTESALIIDAVYTFALGLQAVDRGATLRRTNISCKDEQPWSDGLSLFNYINSVEYRGLTGPIQFKEGQRVNFKMDLLKLKSHELVKVGEWTRGGGVNITDQTGLYDPGTMNVTLVVTTNQEVPYVVMRQGKNYTGNNRFYGFNVDLLEEISKIVGFSYILELNPDGVYGAPSVTGEWNGIVKQLMNHEFPYVMLRSDGNYTGNERFEGFCIDLLKVIAELMDFNYELRLSPAKYYGMYDPETKSWNGLVRELMEKKADLAIGSMTISFARESVIDFTKPFMNLGISILFKVTDQEPVRLFSFMKPLTTEVWLYILAAYVLVSLTMFIVSKFSPYEWQDPHPCEDDPGTMKNQFSMSNSFWFTIGTLMQQGSDLNPKAASTRIVGGIWWFFTLIMISSYTANLAAFLTVQRMITPIESVDDLAEQSDISYGTLQSGSTMTFFRDSKIETFQKMWRYMENRKPSVFVSSYEEGIRRVLQGNYAFFMESTTLDFTVQRNCNLTQIGGLLDSKNYGIATPKGSPWRDKISLAILELQENGVIQMLYNKWWKTGNTCEQYNDVKQSKTNALALGSDSIGGVFVVLICGLAFSLLVSVLEFCWKTRNQEPVTFHPDQDEDDFEYSICSDIAKSCCYAINCHAPSQRPAPPRRCSKCTYIRNSLDLTTYTVPNNGGISPWPDWNEDDMVDLQGQATTNV